MKRIFTKNVLIGYVVCLAIYAMFKPTFLEYLSVCLLVGFVAGHLDRQDGRN